MEACGDTPEEGYTADYVPAATTSLHDVYETDLIAGDDTSWINNITAVMQCSLYLGESSPRKYSGKKGECIVQTRWAAYSASDLGAAFSPVVLICISSCA